MPRFKNINFYLNRPKIKLFLQKKTTQNFRVLGAPPVAEDSAPIYPPPPLQISGYTSAYTTYILTY